ncbi:hypothetical protein N0V90_006862 [Kalmusia sp. IMI 367209]|nr:hypothetical protein N0V90_006862 [Kalmusia sp. IMI 367209]
MFLIATSLLLSEIAAAPYPASELSVASAEVRAVNDFAIASRDLNDVSVVDIEVSKDKRSRVSKHRTTKYTTPKHKTTKHKTTKYKTTTKKIRKPIRKRKSMARRGLVPPQEAQEARSPQPQDGPN